MITRKEFLRLKLVSSFNLSELKTVCFDLGIDRDEIAYQTKSELAEGMLDLLLNNDKASGSNSYINSLIRLMSRLRPNISWSDMPNE